ncbi:uncharacterized protein ARMOST_11790 [Armillaria ostoyae]|uniref:Uncharacterized protein n=1 Tax=Armillaria ostoyae TaxID=47428 RepID=A0A284RI43_ARMOS|nr:uncharacterized protein ARMOST_11790 [Armillaria ostoyae]
MLSTRDQIDGFLMYMLRDPTILETSKFRVVTVRDKHETASASRTAYSSSYLYMTSWHLLRSIEDTATVPDHDGRAPTCIISDQCPGTLKPLMSIEIYKMHIRISAY